jgi:hypothetical protein
MPHLVPNKPWFDELLDVVTAFAKLSPSPRIDAGERVIMSICTGALLLGFDGLKAMTHYRALDQLCGVCADYVKRTPGAKGTKVVLDVPTDAIRYVDAGLNKSKIRVISSGGISCGLDATLYLVSQRLGKDTAVSVAEVMECVERGVGPQVELFKVMGNTLLGAPQVPTESPGFNGGYLLYRDMQRSPCFFAGLQSSSQQDVPDSLSALSRTARSVFSHL